MQVRIIKSYRDIVIICDSNLIGKKFEEGKFGIDIKENFFKGEEKTEQETAKIIENMHINDASFNIAGEKSIALALKLGIISKENVKTIQGIPFSLVLI